MPVGVFETTFENVSVAFVTHLRRSVETPRTAASLIVLMMSVYDMIL